MKLQQPCATLPREGANSNGRIPTDEIGRESSWRHLRMALFLLPNLHNKILSVKSSVFYDSY